MRVQRITDIIYCVAQTVITINQKRDINGNTHRHEPFSVGGVESVPRGHLLRFLFWFWFNVKTINYQKNSVYPGFEMDFGDFRASRWDHIAIKCNIHQLYFDLIIFYLVVYVLSIRQDFIGFNLRIWVVFTCATSSVFLVGSGGFP